MIYIYRNEPMFDTLLCVVAAQNLAEDYDVEIVNDITIIKQHGKITGYNIAKASEKLPIKFSGVLLLQDEVFTEKVTAYLSESIELVEQGELSQQFVIGHVVSCVPHKDSNKLSVCQIDLGTKEEQIVCGASNIAEGQKVVVAQVGCMMPSGLLIEPSILRGEASNGMVCSTRELGLDASLAQPGIMILPDTATTGTAFFTYMNANK